MSRRFTWLLALGLFLSALGSARSDDRGDLQGAWMVERAVVDGMELPAKDRDKLKVEFKGGKMIIRENNAEDANEFTLDAAKSPKAIDVQPDKKGEKPLLAIYELSGDRLKLCIPRQGQKRPAAFESTKESGNLLLFLKREKK